MSVVGEPLLGYFEGYWVPRKWRRLEEAFHGTLSISIFGDAAICLKVLDGSSSSSESSGQKLRALLLPCRFTAQKLLVELKALFLPCRFV